METVYVTASRAQEMDPNFLIVLVLLVISEALAFMPRIEASGILHLFVIVWKFLFFKDKPKQWNR